MTAIAVSAAVSLLVSILSFASAIFINRQNQRRHDRVMRRAMTMKLYEHRLPSYGVLFEATDGLRRSKLRAAASDSRDHLKAVQAKIEAWHKGNGLLLSTSAYRSFLDVRASVEECVLLPALDDSLVQRLSDQKSALRQCLRDDLGFFFTEEREPRA